MTLPVQRLRALGLKVMLLAPSDALALPAVISSYSVSKAGL